MNETMKSGIRDLRAQSAIAYVSSVDGEGYPQVKGALFTGTMEVCTDHDAKAFLWREGFEMYYPKGVDDEDYCVLKFTAHRVNYYHALRNDTSEDL